MISSESRIGGFFMFDIPPIRSYDYKILAEKIEEIGGIAEFMENSSGNQVMERQGNKKNLYQEKEEPKYSQENLKEIIEKCNRQLELKGVKMELEVNKKNNRLVISLLDIKNNEIIKEIYSEELFDTIIKNWGIIGNLIDKEG